VRDPLLGIAGVLVCWLLLAVPGTPTAPPTDDDQIGELKEVAMV
jgi:hypothetical protein